PALASELVNPLLVDEDAETRTMAAEIVLGIVAGRKTGTLRASSYYGIIGIDQDDSMVFISGGNARVAKTNQPAFLPEQLAAWHSNLLQREASPSPLNGERPGLPTEGSAKVGVRGQPN